MYFVINEIGQTRNQSGCLTIDEMGESFHYQVQENLEPTQVQTLNLKKWNFTFASTQSVTRRFLGKKLSLPLGATAIKNVHTIFEGTKYTLAISELFRDFHQSLKFYVYKTSLLSGIACLLLISFCVKQSAGCSCKKRPFGHRINKENVCNSLVQTLCFISGLASGNDFYKQNVFGNVLRLCAIARYFTTDPCRDLRQGRYLKLHYMNLV